MTSAPRARKRIDLFLAHFVRHRKDALIAFDRGRQRESHSGVTGRAFDNRAARFDLPRFFGGFEHRDSDTILNASTGIQNSSFARIVARISARHAVQTNQRSIADNFQNVVVPHLCVYVTTSISDCPS